MMPPSLAAIATTPGTCRASVASRNAVSIWIKDADRSFSVSLPRANALTALKSEWAAVNAHEVIKKSRRVSWVAILCCRSSQRFGSAAYAY
jgi:hypothetical protein